MIRVATLIKKAAESPFWIRVATLIDFVYILD